MHTSLDGTQRGTSSPAHKESAVYRIMLSLPSSYWTLRYRYRTWHGVLAAAVRLADGNPAVCVTVCES